MYDEAKQTNEILENASSRGMQTSMFFTYFCTQGNHATIPYMYDEAKQTYEILENASRQVQTSMFFTYFCTHKETMQPFPTCTVKVVKHITRQVRTC